MKYFSFSGRAARSEYWGVMVVLFVLGFVVGTVGGTIGGDAGMFVLIAAMVLLAWVTLAAMARRCVDAGITRGWVIASIIPYVGFVLMVVLGCISTDYATPTTTRK